MAFGYRIPKSSINPHAPILQSNSTYAENIQSEDWVDIEDLVERWGGRQSASLAGYWSEGQSLNSYATAPTIDEWKLATGISNYFNTTRSSNFILTGTNPKFKPLIGFSEQAGSPDSSCKAFFTPSTSDASSKHSATIEVQRWKSQIRFVANNTSTGTNVTYRCVYDVVPTALICLVQAAGGDGGEGKEAPNGASASGGGAGGFMPLVLDFSRLAGQKSDMTSARFKFYFRADTSVSDHDGRYTNANVEIYASDDAGISWSTVGTISCGQNGAKASSSYGGNCGTTTLTENAAKLGVYALTYSPTSTGGLGGKRGSRGEHAAEGIHLYNSLNNEDLSYDSNNITTFALPSGNGGAAGGGSTAFAGGGGGGSHFGQGGAGGSSTGGAGGDGTFGAGGGGDGPNDWGGGHGGSPYIGFFGYIPTEIT